MATNYEIPSRESYWNSQRDTLKQIREQLGYESYPVLSDYKPLPDRHPLLQNISKKKPVPQRRISRTPPAQLPKIRATSPLEPAGHNSPSINRSKYDVIPPVNPKRAFLSPTTPKRDEEDSWGEEEDSSDEEVLAMSGYHGYPYPMVMYPYPMMMAPPPMLTPRKSKSKKAKKKVHYRNTPIYLSSREHTKHDPKPEVKQRDITSPRTNSVLERYQYQPTTMRNEPLDVSDYLDLVPEFSQNYIDRFVEDCLDDVIIPDLLKEVISEENQMPPSHPYYPASFFYCEDFLDEEIPRLVREVVNESSFHLVPRPMLLTQYNDHDPFEEFLDDLLEEVLHKEASGVVREVARDIVSEHMEKVAAYDEIQDMIGQIIKEMGPDVIEEALMENMLDDLLEENVISPEIADQSQEIAIEVLTHYSNKVRNRDIREIKKHSGDKLKDSLSLDYLLAYIARQGDLWTEGEHANKLLDEISLSILLMEYFGVQQKRSATVDNKPVRRYFEKAVTDVTLDVLLEEISQSLDEDMADLDEYEQELENADVNYEMPKQLKKWLEGR